MPYAVNIQLKGDTVNVTDISSKLGSYWDCTNLCLDFEVNDLARLAQLIAGEKCCFCGEILTEQEVQGE
jgi:hypothetical protein